MLQNRLASRTKLPHAARSLSTECGDHGMLQRCSAWCSHPVLGFQVTSTMLHVLQETKRAARDNYVFRSLNAAQSGGTKCVLIRGTSAADSVYCRMRPLWAPPRWWQPSCRTSTDLLGTSIHALLHVCPHRLTLPPLPCSCMLPVLSRVV